MSEQLTGPQDFDTLFPDKERSFDDAFPEQQGGNLVPRLPGPLSVVGVTANAAFPGGIPMSSDDWKSYMRDAPAGRIMSAFGDAFTGPGMSESAAEALRAVGVYNDISAKQTEQDDSFGQAIVRPIITGVREFNEALMRPVVAGLDIAARAGMGAAGAVEQTGIEAGQPALGRDVAAMAELAMTRGEIAPAAPRLPRTVAEARANAVIGEGEAGYFGTRAPDEAQVNARASAAGELPPEVAPEAAVAPAVETAPEVLPDIHQVARNVAPDVFKEYDALAQRQETYRRWLDELAEVRDRDAQGKPSAEVAALDTQIADLERKSENAGARMQKRYEPQLEDLRQKREDLLDEVTRRDSPDMQQVRKDLQATDYAMRDMAPKVSAAYREAEDLMPPPAELGATARAAEEINIPANEIKAVEPEMPAKEITQPESQTVDKPTLLETAGADGAQLAPSAIATPEMRQAITDDVVAKLTAAGRPGEEANAAAQIVAAYYNTRAQRFEGKLGTAKEMYDRDAPEVRAGRQSARVKEMAQREGKELDQAAYHGSPHVFDKFTLDHIGSGEGAQAYGHGLYFAGNKAVAKYYRETLTAGKSPVKITGKTQPYQAVKLEMAARLALRDSNPTTEGTVNALGHLAKMDRWTATNLAARLEKGEKLNSADKRKIGELQASASTYDDLAQKVRNREVGVEINPDVKGRLYHVELAPEADDWLDWNKTVDEQSPKVQASLRSIGIDADMPRPDWARGIHDFKATGADVYRIIGERFAKPAIDESGMSGWTRVQNTLNDSRQNPKAASEALHQAGIPGVRYLDHNSRVKGEGSHNFVVFDAKDIAIKEFEQSRRGKIRVLDDGRKVITLFRDADASTFMHETGHAWLEDLMVDAGRGEAPAGLKGDAQTVRKWLGAEGDSPITTRQHEKFARGFERYLMEGRAPSKELASVFAKFKDWLTQIYRTVAGLKSPINDDIRDVFDRLLAKDPERVIIAEDAPSKGSLADIHEADVNTVSPAEAAPLADRIHTEIATEIRTKAPELEPDVRLDPRKPDDTSGEAGTGSPQRPGPDGGILEAGPDAGKAGALQDDGTVVPGRGEGAAEGAGARTESPTGEPAGQSRPEPEAGRNGKSTAAPRDANERFSDPDPELIDKAGNIRLDNLNSTEDINEVIRQTALQNDDFVAARRGVVTDNEVLEFADALGVDAKEINLQKLREISVEDNVPLAARILAGRKMLIQSATDVRDLAAKAATGDEAALRAYAEARGRHVSIQETLSGITAEWGRAGRAFRAMSEMQGATDAKILDELFQSGTGRTARDLRAEAQAVSQLETPAQVSNLVAKTKEPGFIDKLIEFRQAAMLWSPKSWARNLVGNGLTVAVEMLTHPVTVGIGKVRTAITGSTERAYLDEATARLFALKQGTQNGLRVAKLAIMDEDALNRVVKRLPDETPEQHAARALKEEFDEHGFSTGQTELRERKHQHAIGGKAGEVVRGSFRIMGATDAIFKGVAYQMKLNELAVRKAISEGLTGDARTTRVTQLTQNPTGEMMQASKDYAMYQTFNQDLNGALAWLQGGLIKYPALRFAIPFLRTPVNILKYSAERSVLAPFVKEARANLMGKNGAIARDESIARIAVGTSISTAAYFLAAEGMITGGGPKDPRERAVMMKSGWRPYSVKVGDQWISYSGFEPISTLLGVASDMQEVGEALTDPELNDVGGLVVASVTNNFINKTYMSGLSDFFEVVNNPVQYGENYAVRMLGSFVPSGIAQVGQSTDPYMREVRTLLDGARDRLGGARDLSPKRDIYGDPIRRTESLGPDFASPLAVSQVTNDPVTQELMRVQFFPSKVSRQIRGVDLTEKQYDEYAKISGRRAKMTLDTMVSQPGWQAMPAHARKKVVADVFEHARDAAQSTIIAQSVGTENDIMKKARENKAALARDLDTRQ